MSGAQLSRDTIWEIFPHTETWDTFKKQYFHDLYLTPQAGESIQRDYTLIKKALEHSYFEYNFLELARTKALIAFEGALKCRYREINGMEPEVDLQRLVNYFHGKNHFEASSVDLVNLLKTSRNIHAHGNGNWPGFPPMTQRTVKQVLYAINDVYEDPVLRQQRKRTKRTIEKAVNTLSNPVLFGNDGIIPLYEAHYLFLNNKEKPARLTLGFAQISPHHKGNDDYPQIATWTMDFQGEFQVREKELRLQEYYTGAAYQIKQGSDTLSLAIREALSIYLQEEKNREFFFRTMDLSSWFADEHDNLRLRFYNTEY